MMDYSGLIRTTGRAAYRNWHGQEPHKCRYDEFYFKALTWRVQTLDDLVARSVVFLEQEARMKAGY